MSVTGIRQDIAVGVRCCVDGLEVIAEAGDTIRVRRDETDYLVTIREAPSE